MHEIATINSLRSLNTSYHGLKLKTVLKEVLKIRSLCKQKVDFPNAGFIKITKNLKKVDLNIFDLIPELELIIWKPKGNCDPIEMPNRILLEIVFRNFIIKFGY